MANIAKYPSTVFGGTVIAKIRSEIKNIITGKDVSYKINPDFCFSKGSYIIEFFDSDDFFYIIFASKLIKKL